MKNVIIWGGSGRIGTYIAENLDVTKYKVTICDVVPPKNAHFNYTSLLDPSNMDVLINTLPHTMNDKVMEVLEKNPVDYYDLSEDVNYSRKFMDRNPNYPRLYVPHCGLAPGQINIAAANMMRNTKLGKVSECYMAVGALPEFCINRMNHEVNWSLDGLINEYTNPCTVLDNGVKTEVPALTGYGLFNYKGSAYETFYTSGGIGTMCDTYVDRVNHMSYSSIRYLGHHESMRHLRFRKENQAFLKNMLASMVHDGKDFVIMYVILRNNEGQTEKHVEVIKGNDQWSAIQGATGSGLLFALEQTIDSGKTGWVKQEDIIVGS